LANTFQKLILTLKWILLKKKSQPRFIFLRGAQHAISKYKLEDKIRELNLKDAEDREVQVVEQKKDKQKTLVKTYFVVFGLPYYFCCSSRSNNFCLFILD